MAVSEDTLLNLMGIAYDAALDEQKWQSFLKAFANAVGSKSAMLRSTDYEAGQASFAASFGYDRAMQAAYSNYYVNLDCFAPFFKRVPLNTVETDDCSQYGLPSRKERCKTEFYNDYMRPWDGEYVMGTVLARDGNHMLQFAAQRGKRAGAFGEEQVRLMNILAPHVTRAVQMHRRLGSLTVEKEWALGALDHLRMGLILTDSLGVPLFVNSAAEQMMAQSKGIGLSQGRLVLNNLPETALLHKLVANAAHGVDGTAIGGDMRIAMPDKVDFLQCVVAPVSPELCARLDISAGSGCVAIFLSRPGSLQLPPKRLAILYGLSPAEARLVAKLAALNSLEQAANDLGVALGTARTQLAGVFAKTGAKGQAELLMLLATGTLAQCRDA